MHMSTTGNTRFGEWYYGVPSEWRFVILLVALRLRRSAGRG